MQTLAALVAVVIVFLAAGVFAGYMIELLGLSR
jgi:hypothetical protein